MARLPSFAWPGGYPIIYIAKDGAVLCAKCADREDGKMVSQIHWEGEPETCAECNVEMGSAYHLAGEIGTSRDRR